MSRQDKLIHDLTSQMQAVSGFIELAESAADLDARNTKAYVKKAHSEMRGVFENLRRLRRLMDGEAELKLKNGKLPK